MSYINILWHLIKQGKEGKNKGLSTGLPKLDSIIGGLQQSRYYCISGATSSGKTALVLYIIYRILKDYPKEPVNFVYFSLEIGSEILLSKLMGLYIAEEFGKVLTINDILSLDHVISDEDLEYLFKARKWLEGLEDRLTIFDKGLSARILYKDLMPLLETWGTKQTIDDKERYILNNPKQKVFVIADHMSLCRPEEGRTLKAEIDLISSYFVTLKRKYYISPIPLMQQNRDSSSMDRRKAELSEPGINDLKDSGGPAQDADVLIQLYYPLRDKLTSYRDYRIIGENSIGDRFRSIIVSKNRYGISDRAIGTAFYGEVGWFKEIPLGKDITDFYKYRDINIITKKQDSLINNVEKKDIVNKNIEYTF